MLPLDWSAIQPPPGLAQTNFNEMGVVNRQVHYYVLCRLYRKWTDRWFPVVDRGANASESSTRLADWGLRWGRCRIPLNPIPVTKNAARRLLRPVAGAE